MKPAPDIELEAHEAWESGDLKRAYSLFRRCAELGQLGCMLDLGYFYDEGVGVKKDKEKAMAWYKRAYRLGDSAAASNIAILYRENGRHRLERQWFERAAVLGDGDAELELAKLFLEGKGARRSKEKAVASLTRAAKSNSITEAGREEAASLLREVESAR
jgi:TPR repeat protein